MRIFNSYNKCKPKWTGQSGRKAQLGPNPKRFIPFEERATHVLKRMLASALSGLAKIDAAQLRSRPKYYKSLKRKVTALEKELATRVNEPPVALEILKRKPVESLQYKLPVSPRFSEPD
jgi:hypothetical protein